MQTPPMLEADILIMFVKGCRALDKDIQVDITDIQADCRATEEGRSSVSQGPSETG